jgi:phosphatidylcholine synthase
MPSISPGHLLFRKVLAWSVHLLTGSAVVWGFLALLAIQNRDYRMAMLWMVVSIVVDSFDGTLARLFNVKKYAAGIDGALLDNILDYFTYVIVPAYALYMARILPPRWELAGALSILLTSAYQFSQTDAKTEDHYFKGFPSYWNVVVIYMLTLQIPGWVNLGILAFLNIMIFVPIKYVYPSRTVTTRRLTMFLTCVYGAVGTIAILQYPQVPQWLMAASLAYVIYYVALSLWPKKPLKEGTKE